MAYLWVMLTDQEAIHWMVFTSFPNLGPAHQAKLLQHYGTVASCLEAVQKGEAAVHHNPDYVLLWKQLFAATKLRAQNIYDRLLKKNVHIIGRDCSDFPERLKHIQGAPLIFYARGNISLLHHTQNLGVVGTRQITSYGERVIKMLMPHLVQKGLCIVSGNAYGVDSAAHQECLKHKGKTIAVQAVGVEKGQPARQQRVYQQILDQDGLVISEFAENFEDQFGKHLFPRRNRLISGLSDGVLVVEAARKSGSLITAEYAVNQNKTVYAIPGALDQKLSYGCLDLIKDGATPVLEASDILNDFGPAELPLNKTISKPEVFDSPLAKQVHDLCNNPKSFDDLVELTGESASKVSATVTKMQLMGQLIQEGHQFKVEVLS